MSEPKPDYKTAKPYFRNPRQITQSNMARLNKNLLRYGDLGGIVHNIRSNQIIGGNQRTAVAKSHSHEVIIKETFDPPLDDGTVGKGEIIISVTDKETGKPRKVALTYRQVDWDAETESGANLAANVNAGTWDFDIAANEWDPAELMEFAGWNEELLKDEKRFVSALDDFLSMEAVEAEIQEKTETIKPKRMARVLVSIPVDSSMQAKDILDNLLEIEGVEIIYGAN